MMRKPNRKICSLRFVPDSGKVHRTTVCVKCFAERPHTIVIVRKTLKKECPHVHPTDQKAEGQGGEVLCPRP